jgi:hypothetical protein
MVMALQYSNNYNRKRFYSKDFGLSVREWQKMHYHNIAILNCKQGILTEGEGSLQLASSLR